MKKNFSLFQQQKVSNMEKTRPLKAAYVAYRTVQISALLYFAYEMYLRITIRRPTSNLFLYFLLLTMPAKIYNIILNRNMAKSNDESLK